MIDDHVIYYSPFEGTIKNQIICSRYKISKRKQDLNNNHVNIDIVLQDHKSQKLSLKVRPEFTFEDIKTFLIDYVIMETDKTSKRGTQKKVKSDINIIEGSKRFAKKLEPYIFNKNETVEEKKEI